MAAVAGCKQFRFTQEVKLNQIFFVLSLRLPRFDKETKWSPAHAPRVLEEMTTVRAPSQVMKL